jgi:hypothetical protein
MKGTREWRKKERKGEERRRAGAKETKENKVGRNNS